MRIIHTGDLHLDTLSETTLPTNAAVSSSLSTRRWRTFQRLITYVNDCQADLLLISGDLFHRQPNSGQLREVNSLFASLKQTQVVMISGNHDFLFPGSPMADFDWCDQVTLLSTNRDSQIIFPELDTVVHGFSYSSFQLKTPFSDVPYASADGQHHILMLHGGDAKHLPLDFSALDHSVFDYIALGHIHKPRIFPGERMAYCGSLEPLDHTETGNHGFMQIDFTADAVRLSFIPFSHTRYLSVSIQVSPEDTLFTLRSTLASRISRGEPGDLYSLVFNGMRSPDLSLSPDAFSDFPQIYEITDNTIPWYDFTALLKQHDSDLIGQYIRVFLPPGVSAEDLDELHQQALRAGLSALLNTSA